MADAGALRRWCSARTRNHDERSAAGSGRPARLATLRRNRAISDGASPSGSSPERTAMNAHAIRGLMGRPSRGRRPSSLSSISQRPPSLLAGISPECTIWSARRSDIPRDRANSAIDSSITQLCAFP